MLNIFKKKKDKINFSFIFFFNKKKKIIKNIKILSIYN